MKKNKMNLNSNKEKCSELSLFSLHAICALETTYKTQNCFDDEKLLDFVEKKMYKH